LTARSKRKKPASKTISAAGIIGQRGINAIEPIALDSGSRWIPSDPNEIGIDGYIELFDPSSRRPLGLTLAVQNKVVSAIASDQAATFDYWCAPGDVSYWLEGNIPVVLIVSGGNAKEVYWAPVRDQFKDYHARIRRSPLELDHRGFLPSRFFAKFPPIRKMDVVCRG